MIKVFVHLIHWGIGLFCFPFLARMRFTLKVFKADMARTRISESIGVLVWKRGQCLALSAQSTVYLYWRPSSVSATLRARASVAILLQVIFPLTT